MKTRTSGLTVIEILVVVGIIALLVGMLLPAVHTVQKMAKETKQKAQFTSIDLGLAAFKSDYGEYPPSLWWNPSPTALPPNLQNYCGAQKLAEALLGWDLLGFHPGSAWQADGLGLDLQARPVPNTVYAAPDSLTKRKDRYLDLETANVFMLGSSGSATQDGLFADTGPLAPRTYVLCDVFSVSERKIQLTDGKTVNPGTPILYYRANPASKIHTATAPDTSIYCARDNAPLIALGKAADGMKPLAMRRQHPLLPDFMAPGFQSFYEYVRDPKVVARPWPYRPDSYLLISAGMDGLYGTDDDIRNFGQ